ncbi:MarR family winged helix-turn-helix transcriptional regulator [Dyella subtropica]|uniref:MarR family winged helix-turn-helix transcriptional regulator n=1 Tax=Dyella subtropica TaxID=2992127 RepID=UPI00225BA0BB|nr:MarR family transcriptional regulator [Dyella subtropica]
MDHLLRDWGRERPELDVAPMAVVGRILHLGRAFEARANTVLRDLDLHYTDLDVLATLRRSGAPYRLTPTALRRSVLITSGAMTACLNRLEKSGLVSRSPEDNDRRSLIAALTPKGRTLIDKAVVVRFAEARDAVSGLTRSERTDLARLLKKLGASLS